MRCVHLYEGTFARGTARLHPPPFAVRITVECSTRVDYATISHGKTSLQPSDRRAVSARRASCTPQSLQACGCTQVATDSTGDTTFAALVCVTRVQRARAARADRTRGLAVRFCAGILDRACNPRVHPRLGRTSTVDLRMLGEPTLQQPRA